MDTFSGEHAVDEEMDERRAHIKEIDSEIKDYQSEIRDLQDKEAELKERYQVADGSQEEADLELLKKASTAEGRSMLSKEIFFIFIISTVCNSKCFTSTFSIITCNNWCMNINKSLILEEFMNGHS